MELGNVLNFAQGLSIKADFHSKMSVCRHKLGELEPLTPRQFQYTAQAAIKSVLYCLQRVSLLVGRLFPSIYGRMLLPIQVIF